MCAFLSCSAHYRFCMCFFFFFKQKTAYEIVPCDWSSDVCSSDLHRHPRWVGMCLRPRELACWSFLMSTAHGAGLMLIPVVVGLDVGGHDHMLMASSLGTVTAVLLLHTAAMVGVAGLIAFVIYDFVGVRVLRRGWLNLDR